MARSFPRFVPSGEKAQEEEADDPMLATSQWIPVFRACILSYHREHPDHDRIQLKEEHHDLYRSIVDQEDLIDALGTIRLSFLMVHLKEWRRLMLQSEFATLADVRALFGSQVCTPAIPAIPGVK